MKKTLLIATLVFGLVFGGNALLAHCGKCGPGAEKKSCDHSKAEGAGCKHGGAAMGLFKSLKEDLGNWDKQIGDAGFQKGVTEHVKALVTAHGDCKKECASKKEACSTEKKKECSKEEKASCSHKAGEKAACSHKADEKCATEKAACPDKKKMEKALAKLEALAPEMEASMGNARFQGKVRKSLDAIVSCFETCKKACSTEKASADKKGCCAKGAEKPAAGGCSSHKS